MAFNKGQESTEGVSIKRYVGVAPCYILAVNPDEKKAAELLGYESTIAPYVGEVEVNGTKVKNVRLDFIVKTDEEKCGVSVTGKLTFFLQKAYRQGSGSGKYQVIDKYGRTAWATKEEINNKQIPVYTNGPANISEGYRPCYVGEEELTQFLINFLNIPNVMKWDNKAKKFSGMVDHPEDSEARLDGIEDYFKGNFKELEKVIGYQPNNKIKLLWGVRTTDDNRTFQTIYSRMTLPNRVTEYSKLAKEINDRKDRGGLQNINYPICEFTEFSVAATDFSKTENKPADDPFGDTPTVGDSDLPWNTV